MRWNVIKEAWALARKKFPDMKRLFVDLPDRFHCEGQCGIYDLENPDEPIGILKYRASMSEDQPVVIVSMGEIEVSAGMPRFGSIDLEPSASEKPLVKKASISAKDISAKYPDPDVLGEQVAYLVLGHEDGLLHKVAEKRVSTDSLYQWGRAFGFSAEAMLAAKDKLQELGVEVYEPSTFNLKTAKRPKKKEFKNFQKVRIVEPASMQLNEGGQVLDHKRKEGEEDFYLVIVDGSSEPSWYHEDQLEDNDIAGLSNLVPDVSNE